MFNTFYISLQEPKVQLEVSTETLNYHINHISIKKISNTYLFRHFVFVLYKVFVPASDANFQSVPPSLSIS